jgi:hypothetical protein
MESMLALEDRGFVHLAGIIKQFIFIAFSAMQAVLRRNDEQNAYLWDVLLSPLYDNLVLR